MTLTAVEPNIFDGSALTALKRLTRQEDPAAMKAAAQQFEALFVQMMLKSMREATPKGDDMMGSDQQRMYESLLDQQLAQVMATRGGGTGLAAMIEKQMTQKPSALPEIAGGLPLAPAARAFSVAPADDKGFAVKAVQ